jgi:site-specific recombinase XerD
MRRNDWTQKELAQRAGVAQQYISQIILSDRYNPTLDSGLRGAEFCALRVQDVDLRTGAVHVIHGKGGKDRTAYLGGKSRLALIRYLRERDAMPRDPLWLAAGGTGLTYYGLAQLLRRLGARAKVQNCHPHTFRRTFALWSLRAGMSVYHLQAIMGHNDMETLRRYLALVESDAADAHRKYGAVDATL